MSLLSQKEKKSGVECLPIELLNSLGSGRFIVAGSEVELVATASITHPFDLWQLELLVVAPLASLARVSVDESLDHHSFVKLHSTKSMRIRFFLSSLVNESKDDSNSYYNHKKSSPYYRPEEYVLLLQCLVELLCLTNANRVSLCSRSS